jgi:hypothetical protein
MPFALTDGPLQLLYAELEAMKAARPTLDAYDRVAYARRLAPIASDAHVTGVVLALRDRGGWRPTPEELGAIVRRVCGVTEVDDLPPAQRAIYRSHVSRARAEAEFDAERRALPAYRTPEGRTAREEARARVHSLPGACDRLAGQQEGKEGKHEAA